MSHFGLALVVFAAAGLATAAPPPGKPVFIHVEALQDWLHQFELAAGVVVRF